MNSCLRSGLECVVGVKKTVCAFGVLCFKRGGEDGSAGCGGLETGRSMV